jgi:hypothetical protein
MGQRDFSLLLRVPCRLSCRQLIVKERIQLVLNFTLCWRDQTLMTLAYNRDFMTGPLTGASGPRTGLPGAALEGRNGICGTWHYCREQVDPRGIESWWVLAELRWQTRFLKELSPGQTRPHSCTAAARALWRLLVWTCLYPYFVSHLHSHSNLPSPLTDSNAQADNLVSGLALGLPMQTAAPVEAASISHDVYHQMFQGRGRGWEEKWPK